MNDPAKTYERACSRCSTMLFSYYPIQNDLCGRCSSVWGSYPNHSPPISPYASIAADIAKTVTEKNKAYGDSFGKSGDVLRILYPDGVKPEQYTDLLSITRVLDKLFRVATDKDALGESPWKDIVGYGLLAVKRSSK